MGIELVITLIGALLSMTVGGIASTDPIRKIFNILTRKKDAEPEKSYSERLAELTVSLTDASEQVDTVLAELSQVAQEKEQAVLKLATRLSKLEGREVELKERVATLQNVPLPVAEHFAKIVGSGEKRSAKRDYMLFGAGVVVSTSVAIVLKLVGLG
ncbi:MAG TPA: hypothetical protein VLF18_20760 [Tahibacter sp.]|uniref:hypothetical protein n=1 Tax=Tahibacter sp. TaxID=2056211 RepID=UPI002C2449ED|nr:hypothetical protein [Tahibacter sp.]HSX62622.1 hypothetical protein [Tahibacter sp.]